MNDKKTKDDVYRPSQLKIGWTEEEVQQKDELAPEDNTCHATREERKRYNRMWTTREGKDGTIECGL